MNNQSKSSWMHMKQRALFTVLLLFVFSPVWAADAALERLLQARNLKCTFGPGTVAKWETAKPKFESDFYGKSVQYQLIDKKNGKARYLNEAGTGDLEMMVGAYGVTLTERFVAGVSITTIFSEHKKGTLQFVAVLSRHVNLLGLPWTSQYQGTCVVVE